MMQVRANRVDVLTGWLILLVTDVLALYFQYGFIVWSGRIALYAL
jgi:hypothetical protein